MQQHVHILVVEDDNDINELLCHIIRQSGYHPQPAYSGTEALLYLEKQSWDMVLLDLMLPGLTGEELLEKIEQQYAIPIIVISAKNEQHTKIDTLRMGADDYITKPFDIEEVSARIDSHLRRMRKLSQTIAPPLFVHKDLSIHTDSAEVRIGTTIVTLTAREYAILTLLMSMPNKVFTKANLFESVWQEEFRGDDNTINVHMSNLRTKLANVNPHEEYIETIWGMGYRLKN
ncbi:response regulator transcription factor [Lysinibacillus piscis]|uniref:DNA-binding response regulator n=1 Tax=Lysinibacillus piscis TaxID=2518931 RepID=A0ABQ5NQ41_9BACI|nr:response regulator transcription factor [Lysinibacillus sp. KH24]GLC90450.1 DNA-binding response regulator [Lysinibacillus sp. KH24]